MSQPENATPKVRFIEVDESGEGQRIDNFLLRHLKGVPRTMIYRILRRGEVRVNKGRAKPSRRLELGDQVRVPPVRMSDRVDVEKPAKHDLERIDRSIIYEDDRLLVINKPSGIAVHGGSGISYGVIEALRALKPDQTGLELVHRIDRDTSGCLMVAKRRSALRELQELQRHGEIQKRYWALLAGSWRRGRETVEAPLRKNTLSGGERVVRVDPEGKAARTRFERLQRFADSTLVQAELDTGRTHQIRVHAAYLGTPILGDTKYGDPEANRHYRGLGLKRLFLHARSLAFRWPNGERFQIEAPLPEELESLLARLVKR